MVISKILPIYFGISRLFNIHSVAVDSIKSMCFGRVNSKFSRYFRAYHEAGHVIGHTKLKTGFLIDAATIHPTRDVISKKIILGGRVLGVTQNDEEQYFDRDKNKVIALLCGAAAVEIVTHRDLKHIGTLDDYTEAIHLCEKIIQDWPKEVSQLFSNQNPQANDLFDLCAMEATSLLKRHRRELDTVAKRLVEENFLDAENIYPLLNELFPFKIIHIDLGDADLDTQNPKLREPVMV